MQTGENIQGLRKIMDFTRLLSLAILVIHFYIFCYGAFHDLGWTAAITDRVITTFSNLPLFKSEFLTKAAALLLLAVSLIGAKGKKEEKINKRAIAIYIFTGLLSYAFSHLILKLNGNHLRTAAWYIGITLSGYLLMLAGGNQLSRLLNINLTKDIFNTDNETFPQEERLLENEYSVNLPARYQLKNKLKRSWINIINPFRGLLVLGTPGAGKSYFVIRHIIEQHLKKGYTMFLYDFKFDDLSIIAYNIREITALMESMFQIKLRDAHHSFIEIRRRKNSSASRFLEQMVAAIQQRVDEDLEYKPNRGPQLKNPPNDNKNTD